MPKAYQLEPTGIQGPFVKIFEDCHASYIPLLYIDLKFDLKYKYFQLFLKKMSRFDGYFTDSPVEELLILVGLEINALLTYPCSKTIFSC